MASTDYRGRKAHSLENQLLQVIVTVEGGHIAAILDKATGVNPLWTPIWPSIEPSSYDPAKHPHYGLNSESKLLSGIAGHNLCMDIFGEPSDEEAAAGLTVHGEAPVVPYDIKVSGDTLTQTSVLAVAQLGFVRTIRLAEGSRTLEINEIVENLSAADRPIAWTQHVTLGPPFLAKGKTEFRASATRSKVIEHDFTGGKGYMKVGAEFDWPHVPTPDGKTVDLRVFTALPVSGGFSAHLMDPSREHAYFTAWSPAHKLALTYRWRQSDFPWLGIWEENYSRTSEPWGGKSLTRGMEFSASPFPEPRRAMIDRKSLFGAPGYRWVPAKGKVSVQYTAVLEPATSIDAVGHFPC